MNIYIAYHFKKEAWGGGNQFLTALRDGFVKKNIYALNIKDADVVIFNGYQELGAFIKCLLFFPRKKRVYRLGPIMSLHRSGLKWKLVDIVMMIVASFFAHVVVFQSAWSLTKAKGFGFVKKKNIFVIHNTVDSNLFFKKGSNEKREKKELIYTSWSANQKKGFHYLKYLDEHLDTMRYNATFIGNSPFVFKNIKILQPMLSKDLAEKLRSSDIFVSPTQDDACSNAILEALSCGLPVVALSSGGNKELVGEAGILFSDEVEMVEAVDTVSKDLNSYIDKIRVESIENVVEKYISAIGSV